MIELKSKDEIKKMRRSGKIVAEILDSMIEEIKPGITTLHLQNLAEGICRKRNATLAFKGYRGFPASICVSINDEVVHGIPSKRVIRDGDLVSVDCGVYYDGYYADGAISKIAGNIFNEKEKLLKVTQTALK